MRDLKRVLFLAVHCISFPVVGMLTSQAVLTGAGRGRVHGLEGIKDACCLWLRIAPSILWWGMKTGLTGAGGEAEYMVALQQTIVQASELQMAPEFEPGQRVEFHDADGQILDASVVQIDASHW